MCRAWLDVEAKIPYKKMESVKLSPVSSFRALSKGYPAMCSAHHHSPHEGRSPAPMCCALVGQERDRAVSWETRGVVTDACCKLSGKGTLFLFFK